MSKILLIQLWIGEIPEYFWSHYKTTENLNIDFLFITDRNIDIPSKNYKVIKTTKNNLKELIKNKLNVEIELLNNRNITILKPSLGHLFSEYLEGYDFFGYYDIDVLFGNVSKYVNEYIEEYEVISFGNEKFHNRISGPFTIMKNNETNRKLFLKEKDTFIEKLNSYNIDSFEEHEFNRLLIENCKVKILFDVCNSSKIDGKNIYDSEWSGGKLKINDDEKMIYHFYDKKNTKFERIGNTIVTSHKKYFEEDFYWVTYLTKSYEPIIEGLISSIKKYSNRKCILYTLNYDSDLRFKLGEQFIFRRIDIEKGDIDRQGRDINIISSKPKILSDSIDFIPDGKFIYIDTDIYFTNNVDNLKKYFELLEDYPLFNSHIHNRIMANDIFDSGEWVSPIDILSKATDIPVIVFPRRKTNVIIYDYKSKWFFDEQMEIYDKYKNTEPGIFRLHDEDSANILLSKYDYQNSLPLIDMEESSNLDMDKFMNYSYHRSNISQYVKLPENLNEIYVFHGFKNPEFYKEIEKNYGKTVLDIEDIVIKYENNIISFTKNNFLNDKQIKNDVSFNLYDEDKNLLFNLKNQRIRDFWVFFISQIDLNNKKVIIEIEETETKRIIYKNIKLWKKEK